MPPRFIFVICQNGAETVCKSELSLNHPELKFAFSRPGFLTFKSEEGSLPEQFSLKSTFARTCGWSLGSNTGPDFQTQIAPIFELEILKQAKHLHVFERDLELPGSRGFEPGPTALAQQIGEEAQNAIKKQLDHQIVVNRNAKVEELVFDVVLVEPDNWWYGYHYANSKFQRWPGGVPTVGSDHEVVSRAYFKLQEALLWSGIYIQAGDICAEIGASPGGVCQLLLEKGAKVIAVDPAELDPEIVAHENLTYHRARAREVKKKEFKDVRWLLSDISAAPAFTLDAVEEIVSNQCVTKVRGMILTLKLSDWKLADGIPAWKTRVAKLGFQIVKTRQLAFSRREICLVAIRDRFALRSSKKKA